MAGWCSKLLIAAARTQPLEGGIVVISGLVMQLTFVALGTYMVLGVFRTILSTVVFWPS